MKQTKKKAVSKKIVIKLTKAQQARIKKLVDSIVADILKGRCGPGRGQDPHSEL